MKSTVPPPRCTAMRADGRPCSVAALPGEEVCFAHSPRLAEKRHQAAVRGGENSSNAVRAAKMLPAEMADMLGRIRTWLSRLEEGKAHNRDAEVFFKGVATMIEVCRLAYDVCDARALEQRIKTVEAQLGELDEETRRA